MVTAVSPGPRTDISRQDTRQAGRRRVTAPPAPPAAKAVPWHSREGVYFVPVRELNDETRAAMRKAQCRATWDAIHDALHDQARRGRTAAVRDAARLLTLDDVGVMGLSRYSGGLTPKTIRRHLECLEAIGLIRVCRPPIQFTLKDGRLCKAKGQGREKAVRIVVTVDAERHCRPGKALRLASDRRRPDAGSYGYAVPTSTPVLMGSQYPPSTDDLSKNTTSAPDTDGIGAVAAVHEAPGLTAGTAVNDPMTAMPVLPPPRSPRPVIAARPARQAAVEAPPPPPVRWIDNYVVAPYRRPGQARPAGTAGQAPQTPPEPARPSGAIPRGQDEAPDRTPEPQLDADAAYLASLVANRRQAAGIVVGDAYRRDWHAERAG